MSKREPLSSHMIGSTHRIMCAPSTKKELARVEADMNMLKVSTPQSSAASSFARGREGQLNKLKAVRPIRKKMKKFTPKEMKCNLDVQNIVVCFCGLVSIFVVHFIGQRQSLSTALVKI